MDPGAEPGVELAAEALELGVGSAVEPARDLGFQSGVELGPGAAEPVIDLAVGLDSRSCFRPGSVTRFERDWRLRAAQRQPRSEIFEVQY